MKDIKVGSLTLSEAVTTTGKKMLAGFRQNGARLLMEITSDCIEDGQNGYLFDNKYIVTVHWKGFSDDDIAQTVGSKIRLRFLPTENGFWAAVCFGSYRWGDIMTLPGLVTSFNDMNAPFTDVIFMFIDSADGTPVSMRSFPIEGRLSEFLCERNRIAYNFFAASGYKKSSYRLVSDMALDWARASGNITRKLLSCDIASLSAAPGSVGLDIGGDDSIREVF